jgi:hypothetical protein
VSPSTKPLMTFVGITAPSILKVPPVPENVVAPLTTAPAASSSLPPLMVVTAPVPPEETSSKPPLFTTALLAVPPDSTTCEPVNTVAPEA